MRSARPPRLRPGCECTAMESQYRRRSLTGARTVWSRPASPLWRSLRPLPRAWNETYDVHARQEADRVDDAVGTHDGSLHGALVVRIGGDLFEAGALVPVRMPGGDAHRDAGGAQMARDATADKASPAEHRYAAYVSIHPVILRDALD